MNENQMMVHGTTDVANTDVVIDLPEALVSDEAGIQVGEIGLKVSRVPIEKFRGSTQKIDRISFITSKVIAIKTHFFDGIGNILCFGKKCCEVGGIPSVRYLFPVVVYNTDVEGNIVSNKITLKILSAGEELYKHIITINRAAKSMGGIDHIDLLVTCTDDKYQKLTLNQVGPANWRKSQKAIEYIRETWAANGEYAYMAVARKVSEKSFLSMMGLDEGDTDMTFDENNTDLGSFFED